MLWTFSESRKASMAVLYIVFCEILPFCLLATAYALWHVAFMLTFGPMSIPFLFCSTAVARKVGHFLETVGRFPNRLSQKWGLSTLMTSPFDRNYIDRYHRFRTDQESLRYELAPQPRVRKRRLSDGQQAPQMSSSFLKKLPLEIRQIIYKEVVVWGSEHLCEKDYMIEKHSSKSQGSGCGTLELAKTCRQIYLEMIDLFYGLSD